jgi:hypothetical protein
LSVASLASVALLAGGTATTDMLDVRAYNGSYWGDWTALAVAIAATAPQAPVLDAQTASQTWLGGHAISLTIPAGAFTDPQSETLTISAKLSNGQALPSWLTFNPTTGLFSGTAPTTVQTLGIVVTATDTSGLSASDRFSATIIGTPTVTAQTGTQSWAPGSTVDLALPANTFTDPQSETLTTTATLANGQSLPGWLSFNPGTETFTGTAPNSAQPLSIKVTATDTSGLSASETFAANVAQVLTLAEPTPNQTWTDGHPVNFILPAGTFTDAPGARMTFAAYQTSGPSVTSWLRFNPMLDQLVGTVPAHASGTVGLEVIATDNLRMTATDAFSVTFAPGTGHAGAVAIPGSVGVALQPTVSPPAMLLKLPA